MPGDTLLGKSFPRVDSADKVTGRSQYAGDVYLPGMLHCKVLKSTRSHARILRIDTSRAEQVPGVRGVITAKDSPDVRYGSGALKDRRVLARDKVLYIGEPIAALAAVDEMTAQEAVDLIEVEYEDLPRVVSSLDAMKPGSPEVHDEMASFEGYTFAMEGNVCALLDNDRGDVDAAFKEADFVCEDTFRSQAVNQSGLPGAHDLCGQRRSLGKDQHLGLYPGALSDPFNPSRCFRGAHLPNSGDPHGAGRGLRGQDSPMHRGLPGDALSQDP